MCSSVEEGDSDSAPVVRTTAPEEVSGRPEGAGRKTLRGVRKAGPQQACDGVGAGTGQVSEHARTCRPSVPRFLAPRCRLDGATLSPQVPGLLAPVPSPQMVSQAGPPPLVPDVEVTQASSHSALTAVCSQQLTGAWSLGKHLGCSAGPVAAWPPNRPPAGLRNHLSGCQGTRRCWVGAVLRSWTALPAVPAQWEQPQVWAGLETGLADRTVQSATSTWYHSATQ